MSYLLKWKLGVTTLFTATLLIGGISTVQATLIDRGNGLIYDSHFNITWLQDANLAKSNTFGVSGIAVNGIYAGEGNYNAAQQYIQAMNAAHYKGFSNWRLPKALHPDPTCSYHTALESGNWGCTGSEMGHLYNIDGISVGNPGVFSNISGVSYWSETGILGAPNTAYVFRFSGGNQDGEHFTAPNMIWAVRNGDVIPNPEPSTIILLGTGLAGLIGWRMKKPAQA